ncbi:ABC-type transport auxiliary lipoprotein family protein [Halomonas sp. E19]|uniref:ABC-type transport auxiliary lipoprotein family protein n=1 Tax=unclassified Halomonas TaxID=2609666 RepID=UPI004033E454
MTPLRLPLLGLLFLMLGAAGCTLVPQRTPLALYTLPDGTVPPAHANAARQDTRTLRIDTPQASGLLDSARIVVVPTPHQPQVYEGARWADDMPRLLRNRMLDAFQADGRLSRLVHDGAALVADFELASDLRAFQSEYHAGRAPQAVIRLDARLIDARSQQLLASRRFEQRHHAQSEALPDVVTAFGAAADQLTLELVAWVVEQADRGDTAAR